MTLSPTTWIITEGQTPERLDIAVARTCGISRTRIQKWLEAGCITVNGTTATSNHAMLNPGDAICVTPPQPKASHMLPVARAIEVVWEDEHILVLNKPAGLTVHPGPGHQDDTLIHALLHHCGDSLCSVGDVERPGLVHRLDQYTSGLMVVAKTDAAYQGLVPQFQTHELQRTYIALVFGRLHTQKRTVDAPIGRHPRHRQKQAIVSSGKPARTHMKTLTAWCFRQPECWVSEWQCTLETGRTHQIRVHAAHIGHPVVGDPVYGRTTISSYYPDELRAFPRQALHATSLVLNHPITAERQTFTAQPPEDYVALRENLHSLAIDVLSLAHYNKT